MRSPRPSAVWLRRARVDGRCGNTSAAAFHTAGRAWEDRDVRVGAPTWAAVLGSLLVVGCGATAHSRVRRPSPARTPRAHAPPRPARGHYRGPVPVLMYHVIATPPPGTANPELW